MERNDRTSQGILPCTVDCLDGRLCGKTFRQRKNVANHDGHIGQQMARNSLCYQTITKLSATVEEGLNPRKVHIETAGAETVLFCRGQLGPVVLVVEKGQILAKRRPIEEARSITAARVARTARQRPTRRR